MRFAFSYIPVFSILALSATIQAATLADADALYKQKKWIPAAKAYEAFASGRSGGEDCWRARLCAGKAYENAGDRKSAMAAADRVIRGAAGRSGSDIVGDAFLLKQRLLFRAKSGTGARDALLKAAVSRLGWTARVSRLHENEAIRRLRAGDVTTAGRLLSNRRIRLSATGSNIVSILSFARARVTDSKATEAQVKKLSSLHAIDRAAASTLIDFARKSVTGAAHIDLTYAAAEFAAAAGECQRARAIYEGLMAEPLGRPQLQRLRLRYADYLRASGVADRCAEVYADWCRDLQPGDKYVDGMKRYVLFLTGSHRYRTAQEIVGKFCGEGSGVYSAAERKSILKKIDTGLAAGDEGADLQAGWKLIEKADALATRQRYDDAVKGYRIVAARYAGELKEAALFQMGECLCRMGRCRQAAEIWDALATVGGQMRLRCLRRKADMCLMELRDVAAAKASYRAALEGLVDRSANGEAARRRLAASMAMCDLAAGKVDEAEPILQREYEEAAKRMDVNIDRWYAFMSVCKASREYAELKGDVLKNVVIAELLFADGRPESADRLYRECIGRHNVPRELQAFALMQRARCFDRRNMRQQALEAYKAIRTSYRDCRCAPRAMLRAGVLCVGPLGDDAQGQQFFRFIEESWPYDPIAEQALFYRLMLAIWTKQWDEAGALRDEFMRRYPASDKLKMVEGECGQLVARRITVLEENIVH